MAQTFPELQFTASSSEDTLIGVGIAVPGANGGPVAITGDPTRGLNVNVSNLPNRVSVNTSGELRVVTQGGSGGTNAVDDAAFTVGTDTGVPIMGLLDDTGPDSVDEGDVGVLRMDPSRRLLVLDGGVPQAAPVYINATAQGDTEVIAAPGVGISLNIQRVLITNGGAAVVDVALQQGGTDTDRGPGDLAADGGGAMMDFGMRGWQLSANTGLDVNSTAGSVDIHVTVLQYYQTS